MDFLNQLDDFEAVVDSTGSEDEDEDERERREYRMMKRSTVDSFDDKDFHKYFRLSKKSFGYLHRLVREELDGDPRRCVFDCIQFIFIFIFIIFYS